MKNYTITVNGNVYDVCVEEAGSSSVTNASQTKAAPKAAPKAAGAAPTGAQGAIKIPAPMPGKVLKVVASAGATVKKGDVLLVLEAMKMENDIVAAQDGVVATMNVAAGQSVESGEVLATMN